MAPSREPSVAESTSKSAMHHVSSMTSVSSLGSFSPLQTTMSAGGTDIGSPNKSSKGGLSSLKSVPSLNSLKSSGSLKEALKDLKGKLSFKSLKSPTSRSSKAQQVIEEKVTRMQTHIFHGLAAGRLEDVYELGEQIGRGAFGVVRKAIDKQTGHAFCCKTIAKELLTQAQAEDIRLEAEVMLHLRGHPNIVEIMGLFEDDEYMHIVEEMCTGGDVFTKIDSNNSHLTEKDAAKLMHAVLLVLDHCHNMGVMYRDVKPDNFLLSDDTPKAVLKATDFGVSKFLKPEETTNEWCGTPSYMAPEVYNMDYGYPADVWAAGIMMYYVLTGDFPFKGKSKMELAYQVCSCEPKYCAEAWGELSPEAKDLVKLMLTKDPKNRPTAKELLEHKWFKIEGAPKKLAHRNTVLNRLRAFANMNDFKKEVMRIVAKQLDTEYIIGLRALFGAMDLKDSGTLTGEGLQAAMEKQGCQVKIEEMQSILEHINKDGNGVIDFHEFISAALNRSLLEKKDVLRNAFREFDTDDDGVIKVEELKEFLSKNGNLTPEQITGVIEAADRNHDGEIDFQEFCEMMFEDSYEEQALMRIPRWNSTNNPGKALKQMGTAVVRQIENNLTYTPVHVQRAAPVPYYARPQPHDPCVIM